jgi:ribosomal protein S11
MLKPYQKNYKIKGRKFFFKHNSNLKSFTKNKRNIKFDTAYDSLKKKWLLSIDAKYALAGYFFKNNVKNKTLKKKIFNRRITIKMTSNNIFCSLSDLKSNKVILNASSGKYHFKITKKRLKHNYKEMLELFFRRAWQYLNAGGIIVLLTIPIRLRKRVIELLFNLRTYKKTPKKSYLRAILIKTKDKKCFNGCRSKKKRRKKRKGVRLLK